MSLLRSKLIMLALLMLSCDAFADSTSIRSDRLFVEYKKNIATYTGNVVLSQSNGATVHAGRIIAHYNYHSRNSKIKKLELDERVEIVTPKNEKAVGERGIYDGERDIFYLLGNITMSGGNNTITGEKFIYNNKTKQSIMVGKTDQSKRPTITINE